MAKSLAKQVKVRALRPSEDEVKGPGFVVSYEHDDGAELIIEVNPSRGPRGQILITRLNPIVMESDGKTGTCEEVLPKVLVTWTHEEHVCGGYENSLRGVQHPTVYDNGRLDQRVICLDINEEPWLEDPDVC